MTLGPVHIKAISELADRIDRCLKPDDREEDDTDGVMDILERLRELKHDGKVVLKAIGRLKRGKVSIEKMAQGPDPFPVTYSCDSGSTTPRSFDNGLYVDFCHCAMASTPTDLGLHNRRTIIAATYTPSYSVYIDTTTNWEMLDNGASRGQIIRIQPGLLHKRIDRIVHDIALYLSESEHILWLKDELDPQGFFIMDGPIYPKHLMYWMVVGSEEVQLLYDPHTERILQNYIDIVDHHIDKRLPFIGFVKNPEDMQIMQTLRKEGMRDLSWVMDAQFFKNLLSFPLYLEEKKRYNRYITYTNWFMQPNQFYERMLGTTSPLVKEKLRAKYPHEYYSLTFFVVYVPSKNLLFKIEAPYGLTQDEGMRDIITRKVLYDISISEIPSTLRKADSIAKIQVSERKQIINRFRYSRVDTTYNDIRWSEYYEDG
ncbi:DNA double-strand break repair nuclease NurA [Methanomethylovorans sp.]|uniref:DNA double-strand break repair nuclease NurA n=1 Tax=Methanomethylovorans sp. TaxID=2758717 RepID=UPI000A57C0F7|nr:DNA double-strand break repair nuclease NurA [Methanomethylovorans sp.]